MTIRSLASAKEAVRCIEALDLIEQRIMAAKNQIADLVLDHPDVGGVADSIIGSLTDAVADSGLASMRQELRDGIDQWEGG